jgi:flavin-dependent dehydrogenase
VSGALNQITGFKDIFLPGTRVGHIMGMRDLPNFFRKSYGDGWALVGDASYHKDPIIAQGISDAFRSAEWLAQAVHAGLGGSRPFGDALAEYQRIRNERLTPMYDLTASCRRWSITHRRTCSASSPPARGYSTEPLDL